MNTKVERVYDTPPKKKTTRILVDRLWPRGVTKDVAAIDYWAKEVTPSNNLRMWYHADPEHRFTEFKARYRAELKENKAEILESLKPHKRAAVTLITAVKDIERSHIPTLQAFLKRI